MNFLPTVPFITTSTISTTLDWIANIPSVLTTTIPNGAFPNSPTVTGPVLET